MRPSAHLVHPEGHEVGNLGDAMKHFRIRLQLLLLLLTLCSLAVAAEETAVRDHAGALVAAATGSQAAREAFIETRLAPGIRERNGDARLLEMLERVNEDLGVASAAEVQVTQYTVTEDGASVVLAARNDRRMQLLLRLSEDNPPLIDAIGLRMMPPMVAAVAPAELPAAIGAYLEPLVAEGKFAGAVLVARGDRTLFARAFGPADVAADRPNTLDTPINLGSMNKMFTSVAIGQLVAAGKLDWNDTVGKHLPDYPQEQVRTAVTVHQLLTHTSGVGSYWNEAYEARKDSIDSQQEFAATFATDPLLFPPGTRNEYSNGGPVILGLIIEKLSGMDYFDYVHEHVYKPAGMRNSGHYRRDDLEAGFAIGYLRAPDGELRDNFGFLGLRGSAAGGGYASANDLLAFAQALRNGALLPPDRLETLWAPRLGQDDTMDYGYLFGTGRQNGMRWIGHSGGAPGISADFRYYPDDELTVVVLSNYDGAAMQISGWVNALLTASLGGA